MKNETYNNVRQILIKNKFPINESENEIASSFKCGRFNIDFTVSINAEQNILSFNFLFPFTIFGRCFLDFAVAVYKINNDLNGLGAFKLNIYDKSFCFSVT